MKKILLLGVIVVILVSGCVQQNPYKKNFAGTELNFRANLLEAENIPVYPNEQAIKNVLLNPKINKVKIAFVPNEDENGFYAVAGFELAYKLTEVYKYYFREVLPFETLQINSTQEASASESEPIIVMLGPNTGANKTAVTVQGSLVVAEGKDFSEIGRRYTDLDLAVDKILLIMMK